jgi:hypothetical protein
MVLVDHSAAMDAFLPMLRKAFHWIVHGNLGGALLLFDQRLPHYPADDQGRAEAREDQFTLVLYLASLQFVKKKARSLDRLVNFQRS